MTFFPFLISGICPPGLISEYASACVVRKDVISGFFKKYFIISLNCWGKLYKYLKTSPKKEMGCRVDFHKSAYPKICHSSSNKNFPLLGRGGGGIGYGKFAFLEGFLPLYTICYSVEL